MFSNKNIISKTTGFNNTKPAIQLPHVQAWAKKAGITNVNLIAAYDAFYNREVAANRWDKLKSFFTGTTDLTSGTNAQKLAQMAVDFKNYNNTHSFINNPTADTAGLLLNGIDQAIEHNKTAADYGLSNTNFNKTALYKNNFAENAAAQAWGFQDVSGANIYLLQTFPNYCCGGLYIFLGPDTVPLTQYRYSNTTATTRGGYTEQFNSSKIRLAYKNGVFKADTFGGGGIAQNTNFPNLTLTSGCAKLSTGAYIAFLPNKFICQLHSDFLDNTNILAQYNSILLLQADICTALGLAPGTRTP